MTDVIDAGEEVVEDVVETTDVVEATDEATESPAVEETSESSPEAEKEDKTQQRMDKLTFERRQAERDAKYWKDQAQKKPEPVQKEARKTLEDFGWDEGAYSEYVAEASRTGAVEAAREVLREESNKDSQNRRLSEHQSNEDKFEKDNPDYIAVTRNESLSMTQSMVDVASEMESGAAVLYHLGKNPSVAANIARMSPLSAAREMGRIEANLENQLKTKKTVSDAPDPAPKLKAGDPAVKKSLDKMSQDEYNESRRKYIANRR